MRRIIFLGIYIAMIIGGVLTLILHLLYLPVIYFKFVGGSGAVAVFGAHLLWDDFLR